MIENNNQNRPETPFDKPLPEEKETLVIESTAPYEQKEEVKEVPKVEEPKKKKGFFKIIIIVIVISLIAFLITYLLAKSNTPTITPENNNTGTQPTALGNYEFILIDGYERSDVNGVKAYYSGVTNTVATFTVHEATTYDMVVNSKDNLFNSVASLGNDITNYGERSEQGTRYVVFYGTNNGATQVAIFLEYDSETIFEIYSLSTSLDEKALETELFSMATSIKRTNDSNKKEVDPTKVVELGVKKPLISKLNKTKEDVVVDETTKEETKTDDGELTQQEIKERKENNPNKEKPFEIKDGKIVPSDGNANVDPGKGEITPVEPKLETE